MPRLQDAHRAVHLRKPPVDARLIPARVELLHRIHRHRREAQIADKLVVRIRAQLLQIPVRFHDSTPRRPALLRQHIASGVIASHPRFHRLDVLLNFRHICVSRSDILQNLLNHLHRLVS